MIKYNCIMIMFFIVSSCSNNKLETKPTEENVNETTVELTDAQLKNIDLELNQIAQQNITSILKVNGKIEVPPQNMISISVPLGGYLKSTKLLAGMHLKKGEIIAIMEDQQYIQLQQEFLITKAHFSSIEKEYFRQRELNQSKATSDKVFESVQTEYISQKVLLKSLEEKLKLIYLNPEKLNETNISRSINIPSPIGGFVSSVNINIGKYVTPSDVLFELVNPDDIHLQLNVFEKDLSNLSVGQKIIAYNNTQPTKKHLCEIILIGRDISPERSVQVHCHFKQYDKNLLPGMYMNAEIETSTNNKAFAILNEGIVQYEGKQFVFMQINKTSFEMQEVTTQNTALGFTQITFVDSSQKSNQFFVTKGAYTLLMKLKNKED